MTHVVDYIVVCIKSKQLYWFDLRDSRYMKPDQNGINRIAVFPGLWIDGDALRQIDRELTREALTNVSNRDRHTSWQSRKPS